MGPTSYFVNKIGFILKQLVLLLKAINPIDFINTKAVLVNKIKVNFKTNNINFISYYLDS